MADHETTMSLPPRWADDGLTAFMDQSFKNILATFVRKRDGFGYLLHIDEMFFRIGENLVNPPDVIGAVLLLRSHSAYRAATRLAMSGQASETSPVLRACLEYALYALHINSHEGYGEIWLRRHNDAETLRQMKAHSRHVGVMESLQNSDPALHPIIQNLYERMIDFGGHPNERAITGSMLMEREAGRVEIQQVYLHGDSLSLDHVLKTTAQVGLGSLCILRHIFRERFDILGIRDVMDQLRREL